jgi:hypothetical protein
MVDFGFGDVELRKASKAHSLYELLRQWGNTVQEEDTTDLDPRTAHGFSSLLAFFLPHRLPLKPSIPLSDQRSDSPLEFLPRMLLPNSFHLAFRLPLEMLDTFGSKLLELRRLASSEVFRGLKSSSGEELVGGLNFFGRGKGLRGSDGVDERGEKRGG